MERVHETPTIEQLESLLRAYGIDTAKWGKGEAKKVSDLFVEIAEGETQLVVDDTQELLRLVNVLTVKISHTDEFGNTFDLREDRQEFDDGRPPRRRPFLEGAVSGKMYKGEDLFDAARREIGEEIGVTTLFPIWVSEQKTELRNSQSYPELTSQYNLAVMGAKLNAEQFNPEGYIEHQKGITTYFVWQKAA